MTSVKKCTHHLEAGQRKLGVTTSELTGKDCQTWQLWTEDAMDCRIWRKL